MSFCHFLLGVILPTSCCIRAIQHISNFLYKHKSVSTNLSCTHFKRPLRSESASSGPRLKGTRLYAQDPRVGSDLRVALRGRGPRAETLTTTAGTMGRPRVLSSPAVMLSPCFGEYVGIHSYRHLSPCFGEYVGIHSYRHLSAGSSVLRPDLPGSHPPPDFAEFAYTGGLALRGCSGRDPSPSLLCQDVRDAMPPPLRRKDHPVHIPIASRMLPVFACGSEARLLHCSR